MKQEHILSVLYDLALITSGETSPATLVGKFLQRLMFHTNMPLGLYLDDIEPQHADAPQCMVQLGYAIGDPTLSNRVGQHFLLPAGLVCGESAALEDAALLAAGFGQYGTWQAGLRLRASPKSLILLLSSEPVSHEIPWPAIFRPVLDNFSHVLSLCRSNAAQTAALAETNRELEAFSYSISHDLRAPLRAIDGFARSLADDYGEILDDQARDYVRRICSNAQRMGMLIDDLLNLSRIGRAPLDPAKVDMSAMATEIAETLGAENPQRKPEVFIAPGLSARGDARLLQVALTNLLDNAWKYSGKTEAARIEFGAAKEGGQTVYFVRDNGAGFDMQYAGKLFGAFQRLHGTEFPGTGIGLATVARIIHRHCGRIWAESALGQGATFFFTLGTEQALEARPAAE